MAPGDDDEGRPRRRRARRRCRAGSTLVGTTATSTKPVRNVARIAPSVPMPESRPTTAPVWSRLESWSLTTIGLTADSTAAGAKTVTAASIRAIGGASAGPAERGRQPDRRRHEQHERAPDHEQRPDHRARRATVGCRPAGPRPEGDRRERQPDDAGVGLEGDADVGRDEPQGGDLEHEHRRRRPEDDGGRPASRGGLGRQGACSTLRRPSTRRARECVRSQLKRTRTRSSAPAIGPARSSTSCTSPSSSVVRPGPALPGPQPHDRREPEHGDDAQHGEEGVPRRRQAPVGHRRRGDRQPDGDEVERLGAGPDEVVAPLDGAPRDERHEPERALHGEGLAGDEHDARP